MSEYNDYPPNNNNGEPSKNKSGTNTIIKYVFILTIVFMVCMSILSFAKSLKENDVTDTSVGIGNSYSVLEEDSFETNVSITGVMIEDTVGQSMHEYRRDGSTYVIDINANEIENIEIKTQSSHIEIEGRENTQGLIELKTKEPENFEIYFDGSTLVIDEMPTGNNHNDQIKLKLPNLDLSYLSVISTSGKIDIEDIKSNTVYLSGESSNIDFDNSRVDQVNINGMSGQIDIDGIIVNEEMIVKNLSGTTKIEEVESPIIRIESISGGIIADEVRTNDIEVMTSKGEQRIELERAEDLRVVSISDNTHVTYKFSKNQSIKNISDNYSFTGDFIFDKDSDNTFEAVGIDGRLILMYK